MTFKDMASQCEALQVGKLKKMHFMSSQKIRETAVFFNDRDYAVESHSLDQHPEVVSIKLSMQHTFIIVSAELHYIETLLINMPQIETLVHTY